MKYPQGSILVSKLAKPASLTRHVGHWQQKRRGTRTWAAYMHIHCMSYYISSLQYSLCPPLPGCLLPSLPVVVKLTQLVHLTEQGVGAEEPRGGLLPGLRYQLPDPPHRAGMGGGRAGKGDRRG